MNHNYTLFSSLRLLKMPLRVSIDLSNSLKTNSKSPSELRRQPRPLSSQTHAATKNIRLPFNNADANSDECIYLLLASFLQNAFIHKEINIISSERDYHIEASVSC